MGLSEYDTSIERTIYDYCCTLPDLDVNPLLCSNFIDLTCPRAKKLFSAEVWNGFEAQFPDLPASRLEFVEGLGVYPMTLDNLVFLLDQMPHPSSVSTTTQDWLFHPVRAPLYPLQQHFILIPIRG